MKREVIIERFWNRVKKSDACWTWGGFVSKQGHGHFTNAHFGTPVAHRISWLLFHGSIEKDKLVCHTCDNRVCVNPSHLFQGTHQDNYDDAKRKVRIKMPIPNIGARHPLAKLTEKQARFILATKPRTVDAAKLFGVLPAAISKIIHGQRWKHLQGKP